MSPSSDALGPWSRTTRSEDAVQIIVSKHDSGLAIMSDQDAEVTAMELSELLQLPSVQLLARYLSLKTSLSPSAATEIRRQDKRDRDSEQPSRMRLALEIVRPYTLSTTESSSELTS